MASACDELKESNGVPCPTYCEPGATSASFRRCHILLACTGSVASIKIPLLIRQLLDHSEALNLPLEIRLLPTEHSMHFFDLEEVKSMDIKVFRDADEWTTWKKRDDPVLHIELRRWADVMVVAPLDANSLAKMATGICDNLLTCVVRAWDLKAKKPLLFAPAMNTAMWDHPLTLEQIEKLKVFGYEEIPPIEKVLMCGDKGKGAMADLDTITKRILDIAKTITEGNG